MGGLFPNRSVEEGFSIMMSCAEEDHPGACFQVARSLLHGTACRRNVKLAKTWAQKSLDLRFSRAADLLVEIESAKEDPIPSLSLFGPLMSAPDRNLLSFKVTPLEPVEAETLETRMLDAFSIFGSSNASFIVGSCYLLGNFGFPVDPSKSLQLFMKASADNDSALHNLGVFYLTGMGVDYDIPKGLLYLKRAAEAGNCLSALILAHCHRSGAGVPEDQKHAERYLEESKEIDDRETLKPLLQKLIKKIKNKS